VRASEPGWKLRRSKGVQLLKADLLEKIPWVVHGFSTRNGADRRELLAALGEGRMPLATLRQIHSDIVHIVSAPAEKPPSGDAMTTREPGFLLAVQTADCVPILLADTKRRAVAAVHAGWRGTLARVAEKALGCMRREFGTRPEDVVAALGPSIGRCCYEVGPEVAQAYLAQFARAGEWFDGPFERLSAGEEPNPLPWLTMMPPGHDPPPERVKLDLRAANRRQLLDAGVAPRRMAVSRLCTACRTDLLFSYRREGAKTGRLLAVIGMRNKAR
jgi:YfiH family protein